MKTSRANDTAIAGPSLRRTFRDGIEEVREINLTVSAGDVFGFRFRCCS